MLTYNTMRFGTDEFTPYIKWALLESKDLALDMTDYNFIERFNVAGAEPEGSKRRFMFRVDGKVYTFNGQNLEEYTGEININNVLENGNTATQVGAVKNFRKWAGKKIYPIIALYTENSTGDKPSVKLSANLVAGAEILDYESTRRFTTSAGDQKILGFEYEPEIVGDASADLTVSVYDGSDWSDYMPLDKVVGKTVRQLDLKSKLHVGAINGTNSARIGKVKMLYTTDTTSVVCGETAELYTIRKNYHIKLKTCAVILKHNELQSGAGFDVYYHATSPVQTATLISIGVGTGSSQTITLPTPKFFRAFNFKLYVNGVETNDFELNTSHNTVTLTAPNGAGISASYGYDLRTENWIKMTPDTTQRDVFDGKRVTRYFAKVEDDDARYAVVKIVFKRPLDGNPTIVTRTATGAQEQVQFKYAPDNITCSVDDWEFDEDSNIFTFTAAAGETVTITYSQQSPNPILYGFTVGWSV